MTKPGVVITSCNATFIRTALKHIRDPSKTAFDNLPIADTTIGDFANEYAIYRYTCKVARKRLRAHNAKNRKKQKIQSSLNNWLENR